MELSSVASCLITRVFFPSSVWKIKYAYSNKKLLMPHSTTLEYMQNLSTHCLLCKKKKKIQMFSSPKKNFTSNFE